MKCSVYSINKTVFEGEVSSVTLPSSEGEIQVLPSHAPLVSLLREGNLAVQQERGDRQEFPIAGGVVEVASDRLVALVTF